MPYKRPDSTLWQIRRRSLPGYGDTGALATHVRDKRIAERMERLLEEIAERALAEPRYRRLLDAVCGRLPDRRITLPELLKARADRRLDALVAGLHDPLLSEACRAVESGCDRSAKIGLGKLQKHFGPKARLSVLCDARRLTDTLRAFEASGTLRNTVRRQVHRAASRLLTFHLGKAERNRIFAEVDFPAVSDTREVVLSPAEIGRLLAAAEKHPPMPALVLTALLTGADRGVLLAGKGADGLHRGLLVRDVAVYQEEDGSYSGELQLLHDRKAKGRARTVPFGDRLARELLFLSSGKGPDEPVFPIRYMDLDFLWKRARAAAGLPGLRFKDLRAQFAISAERAGLPVAVVSRTMGHRQESMTARYMQFQTVMSMEQVNAIEKAMLAA